MNRMGQKGQDAAPQKGLGDKRLSWSLLSISLSLSHLLEATDVLTATL